MLNILPEIRKPRRKPHFANPLTGLIYNNDNFLRSCNQQSQEEQQQHSSRNHNPLNTTRGTFAKSLYSKNNKTEEKIHSTTHKISFTSEHHHYLNATQQFLNYSRSKFTKAAPSNQSATMTQNMSFKQMNKKQRNQGSQFPDISIKILDLAQDQKDLSSNHFKHFRVNFMHYFMTFFHKNLSGKVTKDFLQLVQRYLAILIKKRELDKKVDIRDYPTEIFKLKSKRNFVEKADFFEKRKEYDVVEVMVRKYCVPEPHLRDSCYQDVLYMLSRCLYEKYNMPKDHQYVLLNASGELIQDICEIKFSTKQLFITQKDKHQKMFDKYSLILENTDEMLKKVSFSESLKRNFREKIAHGKVQEEKKPEILQNALSVNFGATSTSSKRFYPLPDNPVKQINASMKKMKKFSPPKTSASQNHPYYNKPPPSPDSRPRTNMNHYDEQKKHEISKQQHYFSQNRNSQSPLNFYSSSQKQTSVVDQIEIKKRYEKYQEKFLYLVNQNSFYEITFNHENQNKILMKTLKKFCELFDNKTQSQINKILDSLGILYEDDLKTQRQAIQWQDYVKLQEVATCKGQKQNIISFINRYIDWNEFDEIDRKGLGKSIQFAIGSKQDPTEHKYILHENAENKNILTDLTDDNKSVIEEVIWSWLQRNRLIENDMLSMNRLQSWYKKYKLAYVLLVSLIFGTNVMTLLDMAYEVIY